MTQPRGLRNRNPGNLRRSGTRFLGEVSPSLDPEFKQFSTMAWGYRAIFVLLDTYRKRGLRTLRAMLTRYAPPVENDTGAYLRTVAARSGVAPDTPVDTADGPTMRPIVAAISGVENGVPALPDEVAAGWALFEQHRP